MPHLHHNKYAAYQNLSRYIEIHPGQNFIDPGRLHGRHAKENQTLFTFLTTVNLSGPPCSHECKYSVFRFVQLCCKFTQVNAFTLRYKRVGAYLGNYFSTFFCVLIFIRIDPKMLHLNKSSYKYGQIFIRFCNLSE